MTKCRQCGENKDFFHYLYDGSSKPFVKFPTCKKCFEKTPETSLEEEWKEKGKQDERERIKKEINKDIEYQKSLLTGDFEKDKPIKWRITGMEALKKRIIDIKQGEKEK